MMEYDKLTTNELVERAENLEESGKLEEALDLWRMAAGRDPEPVTLCQFGSLATQLGQWGEAKQALLLATTLAPELPNPYSLLGYLYLEQAEPNKAIDYFQKAVELGTSASRLTALGVAQMEAGNIEAARNSLSEALLEDPDYDEASYNLGVTYRDQELTKAADLFERTLEIDPGHPGAHRELGWVYHMQNNDAEAEYHLRRAIELDHSNAWAYIYLGNLLWERRDAAAAEEQFRAAINVWPEYSVPYWSLAIFYEYEGRQEEAKQFYEKALNADPDDPQANKLFGVYLKEIGEIDKAKAYLERAHSFAPEDQSIASILKSLC
jgi:tetratricopeptide (TPR) repeat protein